MPYPLGHEGEGSGKGQFHKICLQYILKVNFLPISFKETSTFHISTEIQCKFNLLKFGDEEESLRG